MTNRNKRWITHESHQANQRGSRWQRLGFRVLVTALMVQIMLGCRIATPRPTPSSPEALAATLTTVPQRGTRTASVTPSPTLPSTPAPAATWTPSPTATDPGDGDARGSLTNVSATLRSLQKVDDYPLYTMRYYGPYTQTAASLEVAAWATSRSAYRGWACSLFAALGDAQHRLYGRNFDWRYSPALLLFADPPDGYASVSMVDIAYLVDPGDVRRLTELALEDRKALLDAPLWPFDGMNEHGLAVGMAAVSDSERPYDPDKPTIDSLRIIREMLDHARDVPEAVTILEQYNITWDGGPPLHCLIADASGQSALVEFYNGEMVLIPSPGGKPWHVATNHLRAPLNDYSSSGCWRYDTMHGRLAAGGGTMTIGDAVDLLANVAQDNTQWSVVYDLRDRGVHVAIRRAYEELHTFHLESERFSSHSGG